MTSSRLPGGESVRRGSTARFHPAANRFGAAAPAGLRRPVPRGERFAQIDLRATAITGLALLVALIVAWLVAIARGQSGSPYDWLLAIGGLAYLLAVAWFRWRG
ncbi:MAG TPA: hypothetical protein VGD83_07540 [Streptosporangiaceae bacterium]